MLREKDIFHYTIVTIASPRCSTPTLPTAKSYTATSQPMGTTDKCRDVERRCTDEYAASQMKPPQVRRHQRPAVLSTPEHLSALSYNPCARRQTYTASLVLRPLQASCSPLWSNPFRTTVHLLVYTRHYHGPCRRPGHPASAQASVPPRDVPYVSLTRIHASAPTAFHCTHHLHSLHSTPLRQLHSFPTFIPPPQAPSPDRYLPQFSPPHP